MEPAISSQDGNFTDLELFQKHCLNEQGTSLQEDDLWDDVALLKGRLGKTVGSLYGAQSM